MKLIELIIGNKTLIFCSSKLSSRTSHTSVLYKLRSWQIIVTNTMLSYCSSGSRISVPPDRQEIRYWNHTPNKISNITFIQWTVGYRDAIKLLIVVFGKSPPDLRWTMLNNDGDLRNITAATVIFFDLLLHLFLRTNILKYAATSAVNWYTVSLKKMTDLAQSFTSMGC